MTANVVSTFRVYEQASGNPWLLVFEAVRSMHGLRNNWDGLGSEAPSPSVVESAMRFVKALQSAGLEPPTAVVASPQGTVFLSWEMGRDYAEAEVVGVERAEWFQQTSNNQSRQTTLSVFTPRAIRLLMEPHSPPTPRCFNQPAVSVGSVPVFGVVKTEEDFTGVTL